nr:ATP-dependent zinc metalloprotease FtsH [Tissierella sp.]
MLLLFGVRVMQQNVEEITAMDVTELVDNLESDKVESISIQGSSVGTTVDGKLKDGTKFSAIIPEEFRSGFYENYLKEKVETQKIRVIGQLEPRDPWYYNLLGPLLMIFAFGIFWFVFMQQSQGGGGNKVMSFGKSKAKMHKEEEGDLITFDEVAGLEEEKEELKEIVDFLQGPKKYVEIGARIPKGVLLIGPPGTGKTYLSRAVAGEAKVPFFTISGSDFVEMFVGVGASRVRDLFEQAKKNSPCIIFIDEIDAVGRKRGAGMGGGHDEREQTLNQLLVEMDGFGKNEGIILMAATNRPDILDPALLRPGRFDRQIYVGLPDVRGREAILEVHSKDKPFDPDVELSVVARRTPGFTPADLENLLNEAALLSARESLKTIPMRLVEEASIKVQAGPEKKSKIVTEKERKLTAYHEAGHAVVSRLLPNTDPVHMITIIPRGMAGGFTAYIPEDDVNYMTKKQMEDSLVSLLGGRVSEALVLEDISTGAQNDIERATKIARQMITHYGMNDKLGPMTYGTDENEVFMGKDFGRGQGYSEEVAAMIDKEMRKLIDAAYNKAERLLTENMDILERVSQALLEKETIGAREFEELFLDRPLEDDEFANQYSKVKNYYGTDEVIVKSRESKETEEGFKEEDIEKAEKAEEEKTEE